MLKIAYRVPNLQHYSKYFCTYTESPAKVYQTFNIILLVDFFNLLILYSIIHQIFLNLALIKYIYMYILEIFQFLPVNRFFVEKIDANYHHIVIFLNCIKLKYLRNTNLNCLFNNCILLKAFGAYMDL